jgi:hypothetical protein
LYQDTGERVNHLSQKPEEPRQQTVVAFRGSGQGRKHMGRRTGTRRVGIADVALKAGV